MDWNHANSIDYDPVRDQILISALAQSELWIIDHSTTTEEARGSSGGRSGRGGDLLYRWGNPAAMGRGDPAERVLSWQHDAQVIPAGLPGAGNLLVFNNRDADGSSAVLELSPERDADDGYPLADGAPYGPDSPTWSYRGSDAEPLYSLFFSGVQRLPGGNTRVCEGDTGRLLEVNPEGEVVWEYRNPDDSGNSTAVFRATFVPADHPGLAFLTLRASGPVAAP